MTEAVDWQRLASLLKSSTDKVVVILPSGQALVLTSLDHYESLLKDEPIAKSVIDNNKTTVKPIFDKPKPKRGRPPKDKSAQLLKEIKPEPPSNLGQIEEIGNVPGALEEESDYYPEPL